MKNLSLMLGSSWKSAWLDTYCSSQLYQDSKWQGIQLNLGLLQIKGRTYFALFRNYDLPQLQSYFDTRKCNVRIKSTFEDDTKKLRLPFRISQYGLTESYFLICYPMARIKIIQQLKMSDFTFFVMSCIPVKSFNIEELTTMFEHIYLQVCNTKVCIIINKF